MDPTYDLILRIPMPATDDWNEEQPIEAAIVNRVKLAFARTPIAGLVIAEPSFEYLEHVLAGLPGDAPLTPL